MDDNQPAQWDLDQILNDINWETDFPNGYGGDAEGDNGTGFDENVYDEQAEEDFTDNYIQSIDLSYFDPNCNIPDEDVLAAEQLLSLSDLSRMQSNQSVCVDVAAVVNEAAAAVIQSGQTDFDPEEEQKKLLNLLQVSVQAGTNETVLLNAAQTVQCNNCSNRFTLDAFQTHLCEYDEFHNLVISNKKPLAPEPLLPEEPAALRVLRENQIRIRRFLKDEMKYDLPVPSLKTLKKTRSNSLNSNLDTTGSTVEFKVSSDFHTSTKEDAQDAESSKGNEKAGMQHNCTMCDRRFVHASGLLRHIEKHALDLIPTSGKQSINPQDSNCLRVVIKCQPCGRVFIDTNAAFNHLTVHFAEPAEDDVEMDVYYDVPYEAYADDAIAVLQEENNATSIDVTPKENATNFLQIIILGNILQCEFCDFFFTDISYLLLHSSTHTTECRYECQSCGIKKLETSKDISNHFQAECVFMREYFKLSTVASTQRYFVCNVCEKHFQTLDDLLEHRYKALHFFPRLNTKLKKPQIPCEYCDINLDNVKDLIQHFEEHHFKKCRRDKELGTSSITQPTVRQRQYLCDVCGKSYTQSSHLWQHLRFHQGVKPFACTEPGCSRKFTIRPDLHDHIRKCHTGERPFHCQICGKRFLTGSVFYQHRLIHRGERRYECTECGKRFYRADALKNHKRIHTGEKPFDCEYCTKSFRQRGDCDKHIRARHAHLDENTRQMLKLQKLNLKAAAESAALAAAAASSKNVVQNFSKL